LAKLEIFDEEVAARQEIAKRYHEGLRCVVKVPDVAPGCSSVWAQYSVESEARGPILDGLKEAGVPTAIYYPKPLHLQEVFRGLGYGPGDFPVSEAAAARIFSLPMHPYLQKTDQERIIGIIREVAS
jgi:UDP-2-acetamido-2-deoxy-ribo-hexuluronate aminotransferase